MVRPKLSKLLQKRVKVVLTDGRHVHGKLLSFDGLMNLVLDETQEFRRTKAGNKEQRPLGLVLLRGEMVISAMADQCSSGSAEKRLTSQPITMQL